MPASFFYVLIFALLRIGKGKKSFPAIIECWMWFLRSGFILSRSYIEVAMVMIVCYEVTFVRLSCGYYKVLFVDAGESLKDFNI